MKIINILVIAKSNTKFYLFRILKKKNFIYFAGMCHIHALDSCFFRYGVQHKGDWCGVMSYDLISKRLRISYRVAFWEPKMFNTVPTFKISYSISHIYSFQPIFDLFPKLNLRVVWIEGEKMGSRIKLAKNVLILDQLYSTFPPFPSIQMDHKVPPSQTTPTNTPFSLN